MIDLIQIINTLKANTSLFAAIGYALTLEHIQQTAYPKLPALIVTPGNIAWDRQTGGGSSYMQKGFERLYVTVAMNTLGQAAQGNAVRLPEYEEDINKALLNFPINHTYSNQNLEAVSSEYHSYTEDRFWWTFTFGLPIQLNRTFGYIPSGTLLNSISGHVTNINYETITGSLGFQSLNLSNQ